MLLGSIQSGAFSVGFTCAPQVCDGSLRVLWLPPNIMCGVLLDSKILNFIVGVNLRVNGCFSVCVSSVTDRSCVQSETSLMLGQL